MAASNTTDAPQATTATKSTFVLPPGDGSLLFPQILDFHLDKNHDRLLAVLVGAGNDEDVDITWGEVVRASFRLAAELREKVKVSDEQRKEGVKIAILANTDALTYCTLVLAIVRAGFVAFPLSIRNSVPALEHLINKTGSLYLVGSVPQPGAHSTALQETTADLLTLLPHVTLLEVPKYSYIYPRLALHPAKPYDPVEDAARTPTLPPVSAFPEYANVTKESPIIILHSSGSTSFPKPIPISHRYWRSICDYSGDAAKSGTRWSLMGLPVFHAMGVFMMISMPSTWGAISLMFKPSSQPAVPSPEQVLEACKRGNVEYVMAVPSMYTAWAHDDDAVKYLASRKALAYGGGPLAQETGDKLAQAGANVIIAYGTTEVGLLFKLEAKENPLDWSYGEFWQGIQVKLIPEGGNAHRLVVMDSDEHPIAVSNQPDIKAFDTNDLLEQHPTKKNLWKIIGRADDQIMMSNGEKTNPGPMENLINGNPDVKACLMFGRGRAQVGIAIEPAGHIRVETEEELAAFRNLIWPDIEKANAFAPQHSRIFKEFILVIDAQTKPFIKTPKGSISRNATVQQYEEEIEALYSAAEQPMHAAWAQPPTSWDDASLHTFVVRVINGVMRGEDGDHTPVDETRDLFEQGCDSLQATYIRAAITNALRQAPKPEGKSDIVVTSVPQNLVFSYPTIKRLVSYIAKTVAAVAGQQVEEEEDAHRVVDDMLAMVGKYSHNFPEHKAAKRTSTGEVVLLTGTTGTLGAYLLQLLLLDDRVERVYAVNRSSAKHDLLARQRDAFADRGVNIALLESSKLRLLESDLKDEKLGFSDELFEEIRQSLTAVIHNAWRLDFNLALSAFESNIRSSRLLMDLALKVNAPSPARFIFTSSIGTLAWWTEPRPVPEEPIADPVIASSNGYAQGKWVVERLMIAAAEQRGLRATVWRVGQLAGSVQNGAWNTTDWLPLIVKSGERMGVLPNLEGVVSWLPTDKAAQSIIDDMHASTTSAAGAIEYLHLVHPHPVPWTTIFERIAAKMGCSLVPFMDWVYKLEDAAEDPREVERNPAIKLLDFYRNAAAGAAIVLERKETTGYESKETMGFADLVTEKAERQSETLRKLAPLGEADVRKWLGYWRKAGLFV